MNPRPSLREALERAGQAEIDEAAQAVAQALHVTVVDVKPIPSAADVEAERTRLQDAALADAIEIVNRHRLRLGRRVCSRPDGTTTRQIFELLRAMAGPDGGCDSDPSFQ